MDKKHVENLGEVRMLWKEYFKKLFNRGDEKVNVPEEKRDV